MVPKEEQQSSEKEAAEAASSGPEATGDEPLPEATATDVEGGESEVQRLKAELNEREDRHLRLAAEFDNFRKRTGKERMQQAARAQAELVKPLLEPLDDLARVIEFDDSGKALDAVIEGVSLVQKKLMRALAENGLEPIQAVGRPFDPELHEALTTTPTEDPEEDGLVSEELTRGYLFKGSLLRPALVQVKKLQPCSQDDAEQAGRD